MSTNNSKNNIDKDFDLIIAIDTKTMELFRSGATDGIPNFDSEQSKSLLRMVKPDSIEDLTAIFTINRAGLFDFGYKFFIKFFQQKHKPEIIKYLHPMLEKHLKSIYGILLYQEQLEEIIREFADVSEDNAIVIRRSLGKRHKEKIEYYYDIFLKGCLNNQSFLLGCQLIQREPTDVIGDIWNLFDKYIVDLRSRLYATQEVLKSYKIAYLKANDLSQV